MDVILNWVKPIIYFSIFITILMQLLPNEKYKKYIRFFAGLLMIVLVMTPLLNLFRDGDITEEIFSEAFYQEQSQEMELQIDEILESSESVYEKMLEESQQEGIEQDE